MSRDTGYTSSIVIACADLAVGRSISGSMFEVLLNLRLVTREVRVSLTEVRETRALTKEGWNVAMGLDPSGKTI